MHQPNNVPDEVAEQVSFDAYDADSFLRTNEYGYIPPTV